ncbi:hypothetical protein P153DRAFT_384594 [Dothidotthia symphoricarpi CBS 119687]|uniref:Uncharacterized protein n=1 Tax=Dothidotthia symphoricarpi CBS 119687 TaxID=1392245 RepID=A0A6A6AGS3_9PLEO|nr:uncharacterized protein P153DRAFT_384594 [Dothidotthia symphoricarpi CBS 119687]KAF2130315.1 hypothetical protein P153DRAFT_384594 [Dothidotthia symphoricarpi CBS 119687]
MRSQPPEQEVDGMQAPDDKTTTHASSPPDEPARYISRYKDLGLNRLPIYPSTSTSASASPSPSPTRVFRPLDEATTVYQRTWLSNEEDLDELEGLMSPQVQTQRRVYTGAWTPLNTTAGFDIPALCRDRDQDSTQYGKEEYGKEEGEDEEKYFEHDAYIAYINRCKKDGKKKKVVRDPAQRVVAVKRGVVGQVSPSSLTSHADPMKKVRVKSKPKPKRTAPKKVTLPLLPLPPPPHPAKKQEDKAPTLPIPIRKPTHPPHRRLFTPSQTAYLILLHVKLLSRAQRGHINRLPGARVVAGGMNDFFAERATLERGADGKREDGKVGDVIGDIRDAASVGRKMGKKGSKIWELRGEIRRLIKGRGEGGKGEKKGEVGLPRVGWGEAVRFLRGDLGEGDGVEGDGEVVGERDVLSVERELLELADPDMEGGGGGGASDEQRDTWV